MVKDKASAIFHDNTDDRVAIQTYLQQLIEKSTARKDTLSVGSFIDSASGEERLVDGGSIALELLSRSSFLDECNKIQDAVLEGLKCPISKSLMHDPVTCSDGHTYERVFIESEFRQHEIEFEEQTKNLSFKSSTADGKHDFEFKSPRTDEPLDFKTGAERRRLF